jgi:hypothetical protein
MDVSILSINGGGHNNKNKSIDGGEYVKNEREMIRLTKEVAKLKRYQNDVSF